MKRFAAIETLFFSVGYMLSPVVGELSAFSAGVVLTKHDWFEHLWIRNELFVPIKKNIYRVIVQPHFPSTVTGFQTVVDFQTVSQQKHFYHCHDCSIYGQNHRTVVNHGNVCRAQHFGPKFKVMYVLPKNEMCSMGAALIKLMCCSLGIIK